MAVKIAKNIASKKASTKAKAPKKPQPTPGTIVDGAIVETGIVKEGVKKPTTKIDTSAIAQPSVLKDGLKPYVSKLSDKKKIAAASKKAADADAKAVKALETDIVAFANDNNLADTATIDVTVGGSVLTVGKAAEGKTLTKPLDAYAMLESIEEGLGDKLLTFKMGDLEKHLTSKQLEKVTSVKIDNKKRRVTLKDE